MGEDQALDSLHQILAQPAYQVDRSIPWWQQLLGPLLDLVWSLVSRFIQTLLDAASGREGLFGLAVLAVCGVCLVGAALYIVRAVRLSVVAERRSGAARLAERRDRSDQLWRTAQDLAAAGEGTEALRFAYLSALYALDEHALLHVESSLTNREHALRLRDPSLAEGFGRLVSDYDGVRYGQQRVVEPGLSEFFTRADRIRHVGLREHPR